MRSTRRRRRQQRRSGRPCIARGAAVIGTTRRFKLSGAEYATTAVAAVVSSSAYLVGGFPYLARGVVGDLSGFALLGMVGVAAGARMQHEAGVCLALIGAVLLLDAQWPLQLAEPAWWALFSTGLAAYVVVRQRICD